MPVSKFITLAREITVRPKGKKSYKAFIDNTTGRRISRKQYQIMSRINRFTGRLMSRQQMTRLASPQLAENYFEEEFGAAPSGNTWYNIVAKYMERFEDYL